MAKDIDQLWLVTADCKWSLFAPTKISQSIIDLIHTFNMEVNQATIACQFRQFSKEQRTDLNV